MNLKQKLIAVRERREFNRGYAYADEQLALGTLPAELERQADDAWEVTPFDRGITSALRKHSSNEVAYTDLTPEVQVAFEESLDKDQIDLSLTIRNTHVSSLMQHDMNTWARIAQRLEMARDIHAARFKADLAKARDQLTEAQLVRDAALADLLAEQRAKRHWRIAACLLGFAWALAAVAVFL